MIDELDDLVPVYEYLLDAGFSEDVAASITLQAILQNLLLTHEEIKAATEECGYSLPSEVTFTSLKDRN
jgi:hypothetical protein